LKLKLDRIINPLNRDEIENFSSFPVELTLRLYCCLLFRYSGLGNKNLYNASDWASDSSRETDLKTKIYFLNLLISCLKTGKYLHQGKSQELMLPFLF
jgi:hypothetical protein